MDNIFDLVGDGEINNARVIDYWRERIAANVDVNEVTGCWHWKGSTRSKGRTGHGDSRGVVRVGGRRQYMYRIAWAIYNRRQIPADKVARHSCDNPICVNPRHIELGTQAMNVNDAARRGRSARRLSDRQVCAIMTVANRYRGLSYSRIAEIIGDPSIHRWNVRDVITSKFHLARISHRAESSIVAYTGMVA